jgi:hypothetical protein
MPDQINFQFQEVLVVPELDAGLIPALQHLLVVMDERRLPGTVTVVSDALRTSDAEAREDRVRGIVDFVSRKSE